jgi:hypothetical protein
MTPWRRGVSTALLAMLLVPALLLGLSRAALAATSGTWITAHQTGDNALGIPGVDFGIAAPLCEFQARWQAIDSLGDTTGTVEVDGSCSYLYSVITQDATLHLEGPSSCERVVDIATTKTSDWWSIGFDSDIAGSNTSVLTGCAIDSYTLVFHQPGPDLQLTGTIALGDGEMAPAPVTSGNCGTMTVNAIEVYYQHASWTAGSPATYKLKPMLHVRVTVPNASTWTFSGAWSAALPTATTPTTYSDSLVNPVAGDVLAGSGLRSVTTSGAATIDLYARGSGGAGGLTGSVVSPASVTSLGDPDLPPLLNNSYVKATSGNFGSNFLRISATSGATGAGSWTGNVYTATGSGSTLSCVIHPGATGGVDGVPQNITPGGAGTIGVPTADDTPGTPPTSDTPSDAATESSCDFSFTDPGSWASGGICAIVGLMQRLIAAVKAVPGAILAGVGAFFIPDSDVISGEFSSMNAAFTASDQGEWSAGAGTVFTELGATGGGTGCQGPVLTVPGLGEGSVPAFDVTPLDACDEPMSTVAGMVRFFISLFSVVGGLFAAVSHLGSAFGMHNRLPTWEQGEMF